MRNFEKFQRLFTLGIKNRIHPNHFLFSNSKTNNNARVLFCCVHTSGRLCTDVAKDDNNVLVYEGPLKKRIKRVKLLSLTSSMVGLALLPTVVKDLSQVSLMLALGAGTISCAFLSTPLLLHWITKSYVTELQFNTEAKLFTAKTYNLLTKEQELQFSASDVTVPDLPGMFSSIVVKDKPLFVDSRMVKDIDAYSHMMGYDKPIDFKLSNLESKEDVKIEEKNC